MMHVAFIMDGNRRWSKKHGLSLRRGYEEGAAVFKKTVLRLLKLEVEQATFFAFSTENWARPESEINTLYDVVMSFCSDIREFALQNRVRIFFVGNTDDLRNDVRSVMTEVQEATQNESQMTVQIAVSYGGKSDIIQAAQKWKNAVDAQQESPVLTQEVFSKYLWSQCGAIDLLVRTGDRCRISNFLLWELAYAEIFFLETLWPEFQEDTIDELLQKFAHCHRRFGK